MYDIVIIGGNLSGTSAAINAIEKDVQVALIEKNNEPYNPAHCGEGIDTTTASFIDFNKINCYSNTIEKMLIKFKNDKQYEVKFGQNGLIVFDRNYLEKKLLEKAKNDGVDVHRGLKMIDFNTPHTIRTDKNINIEGKIIIDASGISCAVGKKIGLKPRLQPHEIGACIQSRVEGEIEAKTMKTWFHKPYAPNGYGWIFPIDDRHANIGIGIPGGQHIDLNKLLLSYIEEELSNDYTIIDTFRACVPSAPPLELIVKDNVLITGDAARLANAFLGSGIANAIVSGSLAGNIAADKIKGTLSSLEIYQELLKPKMNRLTKTYARRNDTLSKGSFYRTYKRDFMLLSLMTKIFPNTINNKVKNILEKDIVLIREFKKTPNLF